MKIEGLICDACGEPITPKQAFATLTIAAHDTPPARHYHENYGHGCYRDLLRVLAGLAGGPVGLLAGMSQ